MAQQIVEMSEIAPFGLKRPSVEDAAALEPKKRKESTPGKLWTHEERLFDEKTIYLNKSTTKYVIVGVHPVTFEPAIKICDRATGCHITISTEERIFKFLELVKKFVSGNEADAELERATGITIGKTFMGGDICKMIQADERGTLVLHRSSLKNFVECDACIINDLNDRENEAEYIFYLDYLKGLMKPTMTKAQKRELFLKELKHLRYSINGTGYQIIHNVITMRPYLETLEEYSVFYN